MLPTGFKPMLCATLKDIEDAHHIPFPVYASPKIDGIRCVTDLTGLPVSRNGKPFANKWLNEEFAAQGIPLLDGELGLGDPTDPAFFNTTSAFVRTIDATLESTGFDKIDYYIFDRIGSTRGYEERFINNLPKLPTDSKINFKILQQRKIIDDEVLRAWEDTWKERNYEGIIIRSNLAAPYKHGRASMRSGELIKYKRFLDTEATITGFIQGTTNMNEKTVDAWGHSTRSSHAENKVPNGMAGVILARCAGFEGEVRIGTGIGLTHDLRRSMWANQAEYIGRTITFTYQDGSDYEKVRFGSFKGFRDDMI